MLLPATAQPAETGVEMPVNGPIEGWQIEGQQVRWRIIQPILQARKGTTTRGDLIRAATEQHGVSSGIIRDWITIFEQSGLAGLLPPPRSDRGQARVMMTRLWDATIDLSDDAKAEIVARLTVEAQSMAANNGTSDREIVRLCSLSLAKYSASHGSALPAARLKGILQAEQQMGGAA